MLHINYTAIEGSIVSKREAHVYLDISCRTSRKICNYLTLTIVNKNYLIPAVAKDHNWKHDFGKNGSRHGREDEFSIATWDIDHICWKTNANLRNWHLVTDKAIAIGSKVVLRLIPC